MVSFRYLHKNAASHITHTIGSTPLCPTLSPACLLSPQSLPLLFLGSPGIPNRCGCPGLRFCATVSRCRCIIRLVAFVKRRQRSGARSLSLRIRLPAVWVSSCPRVSKCEVSHRRYVLFAVTSPSFRSSHYAVGQWLRSRIFLAGLDCSSQSLFFVISLAIHRRSSLRRLGRRRSPGIARFPLFRGRRANILVYGGAA